MPLLRRLAVCCVRHGILHYNSAMSKKIALMVMLAFLLQLCWMTASAYCGHETGQAAPHVGHHTHHCQAEPDGHDGKTDAKGESRSGTMPGKTASHPDCASCSASPMSSASMQPAFAPGALSNHLPPPALAVPPAPFLATPERPPKSQRHLLR